MIARLSNLSSAAVVLVSRSLLHFASLTHAVELCGKRDTVDVNGKQYVVQNNRVADTARCASG